MGGMQGRMVRATLAIAKPCEAIRSPPRELGATGIVTLTAANTASDREEVKPPFSSEAAAN